MSSPGSALLLPTRRLELRIESSACVPPWAYSTVSTLSGTKISPFASEHMPPLFWRGRQGYVSGQLALRIAEDVKAALAASDVKQLGPLTKFRAVSTTGRSWQSRRSGISS